MGRHVQSDSRCGKNVSQQRTMDRSPHAHCPRPAASGELDMDHLPDAIRPASSGAACTATFPGRGLLAACGCQLSKMLVLLSTGARGQRLFTISCIASASGLPQQKPAEGERAHKLHAQRPATHLRGLFQATCS
jgi:hypothetical protein